MHAGADQCSEYVTRRLRQPDQLELALAVKSRQPDGARWLSSRRVVAYHGAGVLDRVLSSGSQCRSNRSLIQAASLFPDARRTLAEHLKTQRLLRLSGECLS